MSDNYPLLNLFLTMLYFFLWVAWIFLLFRIITDLFRDRSLSGGWKAVWIVVLLVFPFLGAIVYLIARGGGMADRDEAQDKASRDALAQWVATAPGAAAPTPADQLTKLADLRNAGVLTDEEFAAQKAKILA